MTNSWLSVGPAVLALTLLGSGVAGAQSTPDLAPPVDLKKPPAQALKAPSGLVSMVLTPGTGKDKPVPSDLITVQYSGWSADGHLVDSSYTRGKAAMFPLDGAMAGWRECVQLMVVGETRRCWMPETLTYRGQSGRPKGPLVFDIDLVDTQRSPKIAPSNVSSPPSDAIRTASGIAYAILRPGTGTKTPSSFDKVTVQYTGWTTDGKMFDSSLARGEPATFDLNGVIRGWTEGVGLMTEGERARFWIPQDLAYKGQAGQPAGMLVFDIELISIQ